jgi:GNAT superfamily N-acetyltransferase
MQIREATIIDIPQIQIVRKSVLENKLSDPALVTDKDCEEYLTRRGKGWVCEIEGEIVGFAIADLLDNNIWALFLLPAYEKQGIGGLLHDTMLNWYFSKTAHPVWLSTAPATRAERFYRKMGWREIGSFGKGEIKFQMTLFEWKLRRYPKV